MRVSVLGPFTVAFVALGCRAKSNAPEASPTPSVASAGSPSGAAANDARTYVIGMSQCNLGEPWRVQMNADIQNAAAKHPNLKLVFKDAQNDSL